MHKGRMAFTGQYLARERNCDLSFLLAFQMLMSDSLQVFITYFCFREKKEMEENRLFSWCCISPRTQLLLCSLAFRLTECMRVKRMFLLFQCSQESQPAVLSIWNYLEHFIIRFQHSLKFGTRRRICLPPVIVRTTIFTWSRSSML